MPTTYTLANGEVTNLIAKVIKSTHLHLAKAEVTITALFAADDEGGPALKHHGYPAAAIIRKNALKQRVEGLADATLHIDEQVWNDLDVKKRAALIDHELAHLLVVRDKHGKIKRDDADRPKLKIRPHDAELGIFYDVVERHGANAMEAQAFFSAHKAMTQLKFPWG